MNSYNQEQNNFAQVNSAPVKDKKDYGIKIALISVVVLLICVVTAATVLVLNRINDGSYYGNQSVLDGNYGNNWENNTNINNSYPVPDFTPSGDSNINTSEDYTRIYSSCSPSCCTIRVLVNGQPYSIGSGFVIDSENGYIATNHHVIESGTEIKAVFYNGDEYTATLVGSDAITDLAVLKVDAKNLTEVKIGSSDNLKIGQTVFAIGTPYDESLAGTMTSGIISGVGRKIDITNSSGKVIKTMTLIQTDCSINPGNSGGPLFDMSGNVIGITSLKIADEMYEGIGFAIPVTDAVEIFKKLIAGEPITDSGIATAKPRIGVTVYDLEYGLEYFGINPLCEYPKGLLVGNVEYNSDAYAAGLSVLDIITRFGSSEIETLEDLDSALGKYKAGDKVTVKVFRFNRRLTGGEYIDIMFTLSAAE